MNHKIAIIGSYASGKTLLRSALCDRRLESYEPTYGMAVDSFDHENGRVSCFEINSSANAAASIYLDGQLKEMDLVIVCVNPCSDELEEELKCLSRCLHTLPKDRVLVVERMLDEEQVEANQGLLQRFYQQNQIEEPRIFKEQGLGLGRQLTKAWLIKKLNELEPRWQHRREKAQKEALALPNVFKRKYKHLWLADADITQNTIALLDDYAKGDSTWALLFSCHLNRNRVATATVNSIVVKLRNSQINVDQAYTELCQLPIKENGSLHNRLTFLKNKLIESNSLSPDAADLCLRLQASSRLLPVRP